MTLMMNLEVSPGFPRKIQTTLVTGASGFVGQPLCIQLTETGMAVRKAVHRVEPLGADADVVGDIGTGLLDWSLALKGVDCIVHLAARTHVIHDTSTDPLAEYRSVNVSGTIKLAYSAVAQGVRRIVFLSSTKVNGERTSEKPYSEDDTPAPEDVYGTTKYEAEQSLKKISAETGLEVVILRPPLVYGPWVKGNFFRLSRLVANGWPLPLASIHNRRSLIYVGNLVSAIQACMTAPQAAGQTYLVSDGMDVSTPDLILAMANALDVRARLLPFPAMLLDIGARALGKQEIARRLTHSLCINSSKIRKELGWQPPFTLAQGLKQTAQWYHSQFDEKSGT